MSAQWQPPATAIMGAVRADNSGTDKSSKLKALATVVSAVIALPGAPGEAEATLSFGEHVTGFFLGSDFRDGEENLQIKLDELLDQLELTQQHPEIADVLRRLCRQGEIPWPPS